MTSLSCFFCRGKLLRHIKNQSLYWYCCSCRQEVSQTEIDLIDSHKQVYNLISYNKLETQDLV